MSEDFARTAIQKLIRGEDISPEIPAIFDSIFEETAHPAQLGAILFGLAERNPTALEVHAALGAMRERMAKPFTVPAELHEQIIDTCGTGGDNLGTYNISTTVAFVVAGAGAYVTKHGNRSVSSQSGSSDVLTQLGIKIDCDELLMEESLKIHHICFLFAPRYHGYMKHAAPIRQALGIRTIFNVLGPLVNPAEARRQLMGVYSTDLIPPVAETLKESAIHAMVVHGALGEDEISICGNTEIAEIKEGVVETYTISPDYYGLRTRNSIENLLGGNAEHNATALKEILLGDRKDAYYDAVLLNSAAALKVADKVASWEDGLAIAEKSIASGAALNALEGLIRMSNG